MEVRCSVRHGQGVRRGKCVDRDGHKNCPANAYDEFPDEERRITQMRLGTYRTKRYSGKLLPALVLGDGR